MGEMIQVHDLHKTFRVTRGGKGLTGAIKNLLFPEYKLVKAVDGVSFTPARRRTGGLPGTEWGWKIDHFENLDRPAGPQQRRSAGKQLYPLEGPHFIRLPDWSSLWPKNNPLVGPAAYRIRSNCFSQCIRSRKCVSATTLRDFTDLLEMGPFLRTPVRSLSLGQRMRGDLAAALLHEPPLLFLDEPTIGLDVVAKERIRQFIQHVHTRRRTTIILTTHDISDIEKLCERVIIIDQGKLLYDGALQSLLDRFQGGFSLVVTFAETVTDASLPGLPAPQQDGLVATYHFDGKQVTAAGLIGQIFQRFRVADIEIRRPEIEETIRRIYEQKLLTKT